MRRALQQGQADGMCGLYAVLNFLNLTEWKDTPANGLWYILDACRHFGWLTPQHLIDGYEDHNLKAILDLQFTNYRLPFETIFLSELAGKYARLTRNEIFQKVIDKGGSVILQNARGGHWLLVTGDAGVPIVLDSDDGKGEPTSIKKRRFSSATGWGVVILPRARSVTEVEI